MRDLKKLTVLLIAILVVSVTSCSKDDDGGSVGNAAEGTLAAKIDETGFTSEKLATSATIISSVAGRTLNVRGGDFNGKTIQIGIVAFDGVGTYNVDSEDIILNSFVLIDIDVSNPQSPVTQSWAAPYENSGLVGTVSISSETATHVVGTFEMKVKGGDNSSVINITNGSFNIKLQ